MSVGALECVFLACRNVTTDSTGLCHRHRWALNTSTQTFRFDPPLPPMPPMPRLGPDDRGAFPLHPLTLPEPVEVVIEVEEHLDYETQERLTTTRYARASDGVIHRDGGPAYVTTRSDGSLVHETYARNGKRTRIDGPAEIEYGPGGEVTKAEFIFGDEVEPTLAALVRKFASSARANATFARFMLPGDVGKAHDAAIATLAASSFRPLLEEGREVEEIFSVFVDGVCTPDGVREVLGGAPVEWVLAYESGVGE